MSDLLLYPLLAGYGLAVLAGPLGCFVVWRKMAYLGDTLAHSALLGVALGLLLDTNITLAVIVCSLGLAVVLAGLQNQQKPIASDTLLGLLAHGSLALGLVAISMASHVRADLLAYLFGDVLAVNRYDLYWLYGGGLLVMATLVLLWRPLLAITLHAELAQVEGIRVNALRLVLTLIMALVVAVAMKIVGALLMTALLIMPAATAQRFARTPEHMAIGAVVGGLLGVSGGLAASWHLDTPAGPSIVVSCLLLFIGSHLYPTGK